MLSVTLVCGCGQAPGEHVVERQERVQSSQLGVYYDVTVGAAPSLSQVAARDANLTPQQQAAIFVRELASLAAPFWSSGSITVPALTCIGGTQLNAPPPAVSRIRYSCGATLIAPSFAITAGHCVTLDSKLDELRLQMYRPTAKLADTWSKAATLSGTFPLLTHPQLTADDGYVIDEYSCRVRTRCYQNNTECLNGGSDVALLECEGRPGDKYGFVDLAPSAPAAGSEALMHWKHEVLDVGNPVSNDLEDHYVAYPATPDQNFHYFESGNQLLPLRSIPWADGSPTTFLTASRVDVHGCHGSSGSGLLARTGDSAEYRLTGPVALGTGMLVDHLCQEVTNPNGSTSGKNVYALAINLPNPQTLLTQYANELRSDCQARAASERDVSGLPFAPGSHAPATLFSFLSCQLASFARDGAVAADPRFSPYPERFLNDSATGERVIAGFTVEAGQDYRFAVQAQTLRTCSACPDVSLRVGSQSANIPRQDTDITILTQQLAAEASGPVELAVTNGGSAMAVGGLTFVREGQVNSFDVPEDRLEVGLYALDAEGEVVVGPAPMRFVGDGVAGFEARLERGERLALLRQGLSAGRRWTVRLGSANFDELRCGLLAFNGARPSVPCAALLALDDSAGSEPRLGFYVELPLGSTRESAELRYVALASDLARDTDEDGVPEVLDNCPGDWNASQGDCAEERPIPSGEGGAAGAAGQSGEGGETAGAGAPSGEGGTGATAAAGNGGSGASTTGATGSGGGSAGTSEPAAGGGTDSAPQAGAPGEPTAPSASSADASGCGCSVPGSSNGNPSLSWLLGVALVAGARRRR